MCVSQNLFGKTQIIKILVHISLNPTPPSQFFVCCFAMSSFLCLHSYVLIPMSSFLCPHSYVFIPMSLFLSPHSYVLIPMSSFLCPYSYVLIPISSVLCPQSYLLSPMSFSGAQWHLLGVIGQLLTYINIPRFYIDVYCGFHDKVMYTSVKKYVKYAYTILFLKISGT